MQPVEIFIDSIIFCRIFHSSPKVFLKKIKRFHHGIKTEAIQENEQTEKSIGK